MNVEIMHRPANTATKITLAPHEECTTEGGAMIAMSGDMGVSTSVNRKEGGFGRKILTGVSRQIAREGFFLNTFTAGPQGGDLYLGTYLPGDMTVVELTGDTPLKVQSGSFVAHEQGVSTGISWEGLKSMVAGEGLVWLDIRGTGKVIINAFGMIYPVSVDGEYVVDTGNIAAYEDTLKFSISKAGGSWVSSFLGGEGFAARFSGRGTVWCQTHADIAFGSGLTPHLRPRKEK